MEELLDREYGKVQLRSPFIAGLLRWKIEIARQEIETRQPPCLRAYKSKDPPRQTQRIHLERTLPLN